MKDNRFINYYNPAKLCCCSQNNKKQKIQWLNNSMLLGSCCLNIIWLKNIKSSIGTSTGCLMGAWFLLLASVSCDVMKHVLNITQAGITHVLHSIKKSLSSHSTIKLKTRLKKRWTLALQKNKGECSCLSSVKTVVKPGWR